MGFFNKIKRALGFTPDGEDVDELDIYEMSNHTPYENPFARRTEDKQVETAASDAPRTHPSSPPLPKCHRNSPPHNYQNNHNRQRLPPPTANS